jgi:hypothetical protein
MDVLDWASGLQLTAVAASQLSLLGESERRRILVILRRKLSTTIVHNVSSYLMGVIKREIGHSAAAPAAMAALAVNSGMPRICHQCGRRRPCQF